VVEFSAREGFAVKLDRIVGRTKWDKARFGISVVMDMIGNGSYLGYLLGPGAVVTEGSDAVFAPIQGLWLLLAYHRWDSVGAAVFGGLEELMPGTDAVPTCTLYHVYCMRAKYRDAVAAGSLPSAAPSK
jgi:hypothetical protein